MVDLQLVVIAHNVFDERRVTISNKEHFGEIGWYLRPFHFRFAFVDDDDGYDDARSWLRGWFRFRGWHGVGGEQLQLHSGRQLWEQRFKCKPHSIKILRTRSFTWKTEGLIKVAGMRVPPDFQLRVAGVEQQAGSLSFLSPNGFRIQLLERDFGHHAWSVQRFNFQSLEQIFNIWHAS
jgi:hypothetical protein